MKKGTACSAVIAVAVLFMAGLLPADELSGTFAGATRLMAIGAKAKYEGKDEVAWGEYARARAALAELRRKHPDWHSGSVLSSLQRCRTEMDSLDAGSVKEDRDVASGQRKSLKLLAAASGQADQMVKVLDETMGILKKVTVRKKPETVEPETKVAAPATADTDGDGLTDEREAKLGTNPAVADTDGDGLTDFAEVETHGTSPTLSDTDGDGLSDGFEIKSFDTDPLNPDTDSEGLTDGDEYRRGTDPNNPDTDGDGESDKDEVDEGYDPLTHIDEAYE